MAATDLFIAPPLTPRALEALRSFTDRRLADIFFLPDLLLAMSSPPVCCKIACPSIAIQETPQSGPVRRALQGGPRRDARRVRWSVGDQRPMTERRERT